MTDTQYDSIRGFILFLIAVSAANGLDEAYMVGRLQQPEVAYFAMATVLLFGLAVYEFVNSPLVAKFANTARSVMSS